MRRTEHRHKPGFKKTFLWCTVCLLVTWLLGMYTLYNLWNYVITQKVTDPSYTIPGETYLARLIPDPDDSSSPSPSPSPSPYA